MLRIQKGTAYERTVRKPAAGERGWQLRDRAGGAGSSLACQTTAASGGPWEIRRFCNLVDVSLRSGGTNPSPKQTIKSYFSETAAAAIKNVKNDALIMHLPWMDG